MIRIGILGDIGSGKSFVAKNFGYPVFNADLEVSKLYKKNKKMFFNLKKTIPNYISSFPVDKNEIVKAILANKVNLNKIIKIVHKEVGKEMKVFLKKNKNKKYVVLDIPLLLENNINRKEDILVYVQSSKTDIEKKLKKRPGFNPELLKKFKKIQFKLDYKKKKSQYILKNKFTERSIKKGIKKILDQI
tara:strand:+ start:3335 stop:3901 length:567 start_codon:yes stop_codon:yes gene_type:complete